MTVENQYPEQVRYDSHIMLAARKYAFITPTGHQVGIEVKDIVWNCFLYVPTGIVDNIAAQWTETSLTDATSIGAGVANLANVEFGAINTLKNALQTVKTGLTRAAFEKGGKTITDLAAIKGATYAPNEIMTFKGMGNRGLALTYKMVPRSANEAKEIRQILARFQQAGSSRMEALGVMPTIHYPLIFDIRVYPKRSDEAGTVEFTDSRKKEDHGIMSWDSMALDNISVEFGGGNQSALFHWDGAPVEVTLSLSFKSLRPAYRNSTDAGDSEDLIPGLDASDKMAEREKDSKATDQSLGPVIEGSVGTSPAA